MTTVKRLTPVLVTLAIALAITACGGGGGGSTVSTGGGVITPPVAVLSIIASPPVLPSINGTTGVGTAVTTALSVEFAPLNLANPTAATFSTSTGAGATFTCGGVSVGNVLIPGFSIAQVVGTPRFVATGSFSATGLPASSNCIFSLPLTITGGGVVSNPVTISFSFTTAQAQAACTPPAMKNSLGVCLSPPAVAGYAWNTGLGAWVADVGVKVIGTNELPAGCTFWADQCWKDSVANGTVKFIATHALMVGFNDRPVVFAYYRLYSTVYKANAWNYLAIYADDGSLVGFNIFGGNREEIDFAQGSTKGVVIHTKPTGDCYEMAWDIAQKIWNVNGGAPTLPITCPK